MLALSEVERIENGASLTSDLDSEAARVAARESGDERIKSLTVMKRIVFALALALIAQSIYAQDWAKERLNKSPRHGEWVDLKSGDRTIKAFVVYPERKEKTPLVIVIHEIFGLTEWVRGICDKLDENGVIAIAPDLRQRQTVAKGALGGPI